mmetsp:Transcript_27359/g.58562  ORF Transcript_27359/g.58562 Transcript_27359/m.58562 type:complete len:146 (-) Transcript_27359:609-1046(-)
MFNSLCHVVPRTTQLYQECRDALVTGMDMVLKETRKRLNSFTVDEMAIIGANFELVFFILAVDDIAIGDGDVCLNNLLHNTKEEFVCILKNKLNAATMGLSSDRDLKTMMERGGAAVSRVADAKRLLVFLIENPTLSPQLGRENQ